MSSSLSAMLNLVDNFYQRADLLFAAQSHIQRVPGSVHALMGTHTLYIQDIFMMLSCSYSSAHSHIICLKPSTSFTNLTVSLYVHLVGCVGLWVLNPFTSSVDEMSLQCFTLCVHMQRYVHGPVHA